MNTPAAAKTPKARSPRYPIVGLKSAIDRARLVYEKDYQNKIQTLDAAKHMGFTTLNGKALGVLSALRKYGLLEGSDGSVRVSDLALKIIAHKEGDPERAAAIAEAATGPELFAAIEKKWPGGKVSDQALRSYLLTEKFLPDAADTAIRAFRETKELAEVESVEQSPPVEKPQVGDIIQWTINGADQFPTPQRVVAIQPHDGKDWLFVESSTTGIPMEQATVTTKGTGEKPPPFAGVGVDQHGLQQGRRTPAKHGTRQEVFALDEGDVVLTFPDGLSLESYNDLQSYIEVFLRKAKRRAEKKDESDSAE